MYVYNTEKNITEKGLNNSSTKLLDKSDIIISARGTVGALAQLSKPMAFNQSCFGIRSNDRSTNDFLYYFLKNNVSKIQQNAHGSVFDTITMDSLKSTEILLPSLEEQGEIAGVLGALDDKIEANRKQNETLEAMAAAIFKSWFIDFEPFNSTMPSDWEEKALCDI